MEAAAAGGGTGRGGGGEPRGQNPGGPEAPGGSRSYLVLARDGWLAPSGIRGSGASGGRRRPLPRPPLLFPASVAAATAAAAAPTPPEGGPHPPSFPLNLAPIARLPPEQIPIPARVQPLPRPATSPRPPGMPGPRRPPPPRRSPPRPGRPSARL